MNYSADHSLSKIWSVLVLLVVLLQQTKSSNSYFKPTIKKPCENQVLHKVDIDSLGVYPELDFKAKWTRDHKHFWKSSEFDFEARYLKENKQRSITYRNFSSKKTLKVEDQGNSQVKVFVLPFSHNDPGWKQTYEGYFYSFTKKILNNAVYKLSEYKNMTFAWSEVSFLSKWWDEASDGQKNTLRRLVKEGRFEILSGGWVMPDEATTTTFALVNQLVEGHQWIKKYLNILPTSAWSIDAFGHSSTMPYLLKRADISGMMIQRVHYAWKHWFGKHREGDFVWLPRWSSNEEKDGIVCHNAHYDLYPTKHSCGPYPNVCMRFDFRVLEGVRAEHVAYVQQVDRRNIQSLADHLTGQYGRTASLTKHNIVATSLGGDFRFDDVVEWDQQYKNYNLLFNFINTRQKNYHMSAKFGTLSDYFRRVRESNISLSTFSGDFFPYTDILFPFAPAYWTGYYSTRPFWKMLDREVEDELLKAEILFTFAYNFLRQHNYSGEILFRNYDNLVYARRSLALFQHHDGITGTSPRDTMLDYARKLTQAWNFSRQIQKLAIESIWKNHLNILTPPLISETEKLSYTSPSQKMQIKMFSNTKVVKKVVLFNSLAWKRSQLVRLVIVMIKKDDNIFVKGPQGEPIVAQVTEVQNHPHENTFELLFVAELPALTVVTFEVCRGVNDGDVTQKGTAVPAVRSRISCKNCHNLETYNQIKGNEITLDNEKVIVYFDTDLGLLKRIEDKRKAYTVNANVTMSFGRYDAIYGSGAYLLHPYTSSPHTIFNSSEASLYVVVGPVISEVVLITPRLTLKSWILHTGSEEIMSAVHMSVQTNGTDLDQFGEYFMRFQSNLNNTEKAIISQDKPCPVLFTDTNGLSVEKRVTIGKLPYQANTFPLTHFAFIQDNKRNLRLNLLADRSHAVSSIVRGRIEIIFDRRLRYDDARGMDEGVMDFEYAVSNYIIKLEEISNKVATTTTTNFNSWEPSLSVQKLSKYLNHQPTIFIYDALSIQENGHISLFSDPFPDDIHLLNLRTLSLSNIGDFLFDDSSPGTNALMILQRLGHYQQKSSKENKNCKNDNDAPLLNSSIRLNYSVKQTNLVGTQELSSDNYQEFGATTSKIRISEPHELSSFLIQF